MKFLEKANYLKEVRKLFQNEEALNIAVAFWGIEALQLFKSIPSNKEIKLICNLESSACNPFLIEELMHLKNIQLRTNKYLHAKVLLQNKSAIIGSANISANGLALEGKELNGWLEAGIHTGNMKTIVNMTAWYQKVWDSSSVITDIGIEHHKILWKNKRNQRQVNSYELSLLDAAHHDSDNFIDREVYFAIYRNRNASNEALETFETAKDVHSSLSEKIDFYEEWSDIPDNVHLISIYYGPRGGFYIDGIYKTPEKALIEGFTRKNGTQGEIKLCFKTESIHGYELSASDELLIKQNIKKLMNFQPNSDDAFLIPLVDGVNLLK